MGKTAIHFDDRAIGVFDSGVGGLTVVKQLIKKLPHESIIYFGDTARIPYGTKSEEIVRRFSLEDSFFLMDKNVKLIVVACNTASAIAVPMLQNILDIPVIGVLEPGARAAATLSSRKRIGVIGTAATIRSNSYQKEIKAITPESQIIQQACPLFVPMVEEGWTEDDVTYLIAKRYLHILLENQVDTVILGCTHYPLLRTAIQKTLGPAIRLVDSGIETAETVKKMLHKKNISAPDNTHPKYYFYLSDMPYKFQEIAERFLERTVPHVETINFDQFLIEKGEQFWKKYQDLLTKVY
ncbi:MAG: glutamate racemase [bacterium]|nr:MAG: glutamate racemase [bacterium]